MSARNRTRQGFTLVEILIVVVILGILAAIVIPQFTSASETAKGSNLVSQLQTIRSQLELYQVQHNGDYPDLSSTPSGGTGGVWSQLTDRTDVSGNIGTTDGTHIYGPYLQKPPANAFNDPGADVAVNVVTGTTAVTGTPGTHGWAYNSDTGEIKAVISADLAALLNLDTNNDVVTGSSGGSSTQ